MDIKKTSNYTNKDIAYLKNVEIKEFDMESGGFSVIREYELLDKEMIAKLDSIEKKKRNIMIGKLQAKFPDLSKSMVEGFGLARESFVNQNEIPMTKVLSIKKDALFLVNPGRLNSKVGNYINFREKNVYTSYMALNRREFYYSMLTNELTVKGFSDDVKDKQKDYLFNDFKKIIKQNEKVDRNTIFKTLQKYRDDYLNKKLPIETYRNVDTGLFTIGDFESESAEETDLDNLDISYNYINYVLPLIKNIL